ncbi:MAG: IS30 family transposase [Gammaproteobacteria bacterium]|nr:MAG: IS30 family transposase [Gammaproteobacteria bacterium]
MTTYAQLTQAQRYQIHALYTSGSCQAEIARKIGVHRSTICRELRRLDGRNDYDPQKAHAQAVGFRVTAHNNSRIKGTLEAAIRVFLGIDFSPEQIAGVMKRFFGISISFQSIYRFLKRCYWYGDELYKKLRIAGKRRSYIGNEGRHRKRRQAPVLNRISIHERPEEANLRSQTGHWEIDTVIGPRHASAILTLTERVSRYCILLKLRSKQSQSVIDALEERAFGLRTKVRTITSDNGSEFAKHQKIADLLQCKFYFADPYSAWQRGTNENANGLVRQYFPKHTDFNNITQEELDSVAFKLNNRPRKVLGFDTPANVLWGLQPFWLK